MLQRRRMAKVQYLKVDIYSNGSLLGRSMIMRHFFQACLLVSFCLCLPLSFFVLQAQEVLEAQYEIPDPLALEAGWWDRFVISDGTLPQGIEQLERRLEELVVRLPEDRRVNGEALVKRSLANLNKLLELKQRPAPVLPGQRVIAQEYTVEQLLTLVQQYRDADRQFVELSTEVQLQSKFISTLKERLDQLFLEYRGLQEVTVERLWKGLEIIAERSGLAVAEARLVDYRTRRHNQETMRLILEKELLVAKERIVFERNGDKIAKIIEEASQAYEQARKQRIESELEIAIQLKGDEEDLPQLRFLEQKVTRFSVTETLANLRVILAEITFFLVKMQDMEEAQTADSFNENFERWSGGLGKVKGKLSGYRQETEQEQDRLSAGYVKVIEETPAQINLRRQRHIEVAQTTSLIQQVEDEIFKLELLIQFARSKLHTQQGLWQRGWVYLEMISDGIVRIWKDWTRVTIFRVGDAPVALRDLLGAILVFLGILIFSRLVRLGLVRMLKRTKEKESAALYTLNKMIQYGFLLFGFVVALAFLGIGFRNLAIILGALSVGIGFGLQNIVNNFLCGLIILFEGNVKIGDMVELPSGNWGIVKEVKVQNTVLHSFRGLDIMIPNSQIVSEGFINWTLHDPFQRLHIPFSVAYGSDKDKLREIVVEVAKQQPSTISGIKRISEPQVWMKGFGDSALEFELVVWVNLYAWPSRSSIKSSYFWAIETALKEAGITIPFPQRDLHLKTVPPSFLEERKNALTSDDVIEPLEENND